MKFNYLFFLLKLCLLSSCIVSHQGALSGNLIDQDTYRIQRIVHGQSKAFRLLGLGSARRTALVKEAKENLYRRHQLQKGQILANFSVDIQDTYYFFFF